VTEIEPVRLPAPSRVGQGTLVEQTRAAAEVAAAVRVAQDCPRNIQVAVAEMRESCKQQGLADRAFYEYRRGGARVTGPTVHLARELARCWGNIQYGLVELRRDDAYGQSEMQAFAWDVQTNSRNSSTFVVPHKRDTKDGPVFLTDARDIYEVNSNNGARRVRECILAILPPWFVEEAKDLCYATLKNGGGIPLAKRIANAIEKFADIGITLDQLEVRTGRSSNVWTAHDAAQLGITYNGLQRGEIRKEDEFPAERVDAEQIAGARPVTVPPVPPGADAEAAAEAGWPDVAPVPGDA
jgi:hypothetical protein